MKLTPALAALGVTLLATPALAQTVINFDELPVPPTDIPNNSIGNLPTPYFGFTWTNIGYYSTTNSTFTTGPSSGTQAGVVDNFGANTVINSGKFNFISAYLSTPNDPSLTLNLVALNGATVVSNQTFTVTSTVTKFTFNLDDITELEFNTTDFISIDDFTFTTVSPGTHFASTPGLNANQQGVATPIDHANAITPANGNLAIVTNALSNQSAAALPGALDELTPVKFANFTAVTAVNDAAFDNEAMDDYLAGQRTGPDGAFAAGNGSIDSTGLTVNDPDYDPTLAMVHSRLMSWNPAPAGAISDVGAPLLGGVDMKQMKEPAQPPPDPWNFFIRGNVILAQGLSQQNVPHFDDNTESVTVGADYRLTPHILLGLDAAYAHTDATLDNDGSSATVDSYSPGFYAAYADDGWYANLTGNYLYNAYTQDRVIGFLSQSATSSPTGNEGTGDLDAGYDFHFGALTAGPIAGVQYTHLTVNSYDENNSAAALDVDEQQADSLRSRLGLNLRYDLHDGDTIITPRLQATWQHEFLSQDLGLTSQFNGFGGGSFVSRTPNASDDSALIDAGVDAAFNRDVTLFLDYMVQAGQDNYFGQSVQGGVKIGF